MCFCAGPGISSYANDPPSAGKSLVACLEEAMNIIPPEGQRGAPAYLGATAGMRLLDLENKTASDMVLSEVSKTISRYPVDFRGARIISGKEEGSYGWITINYLLDIPLVVVGFAQCPRRFTALWTSVELPHKSASFQRWKSQTQGKGQTLNFMASPTVFTHTASCAMGRTRP
ncbi:hypothetical protein AB205_0022190 [Aquarana catesbeiana]|uniref:Uncharacterized protein n=1 Tax=Aquarana catesbeiana TaxID=8400 RepID=A0A2G9SCP1_AQUCT|nr:hypothetical protein AB205_0022190 [Aquarana catesbeiana]